MLGRKCWVIRVSFLKSVAGIKGTTSIPKSLHFLGCNGCTGAAAPASTTPHPERRPQRSCMAAARALFVRVAAPDLEEDALRHIDAAATADAVVCKRSRPPKLATAEEPGIGAVLPAKRKRGRPRKAPDAPMDSGGMAAVVSEHALHCPSKWLSEGPSCPGPISALLLTSQPSSTASTFPPWQRRATP